MDGNFINTVFAPSLIGTFIDVLTWVAISLVFFEILNLFTKDKFYAAIENSKRGQVFISAVLGLVPGCGGALLLVPLYNKRKISFAALTAGFIATFGDAAFVILALDPITFLNLLWIGFIAAIVWGYLLEWTKLNNYLENRINQPLRKDKKEMAKDLEINDAKWWQIEKKRLPHWFLIFDRFYAPIMVWSFVLIIFPGTIMNLVPAWSELWAMQVFEQISLIGTLFIIIVHIFRKSMMKLYVSWNYHEHPHDHLQTYDHVNHKIAKTKNKRDEVFHILNDIYANTVWLGTWIFIGLFSFETLYYVAEDSLNAFFALGDGFMGILIGIVVGIIPGCGAQIAFANFYFGGNLLFASLLGNSINQDGDAAFALMATEPRTITWMRIMNIVPAFIFSSVVFGLEISGVVML